MPLTAKGNEILHNMEQEHGAKAGESEFYASKNKGTIHGVDELPSMDAIPIPDCWRTGDEAPAYNSVPLISPTAIGGLPTQPSGVHEPSDEALPGPHGEAAALKAGPLGPEPPPYSDVPNPLEGAGHGRDSGLDAYNASLHADAKGLRTGEWAVVNGKEVMVQKIDGDRVTVKYGDGSEATLGRHMFGAAGRDAGATPPPPAHEGCDPAMSFDLLAAMGHGRGVDWSGDVSGLPKSVSQEQMVNFGASMNFGEGVTK